MTMTNERIRRKAIKMYDDGTWGACQISLPEAGKLKLEYVQIVAEAS